MGTGLQLLFCRVGIEPGCAGRRAGRAAGLLTALLALGTLAPPFTWAEEPAELSRLYANLGEGNVPALVRGMDEATLRSLARHPPSASQLLHNLFEDAEMLALMTPDTAAVSALADRAQALGEACLAASSNSRAARRAHLTSQAAAARLRREAGEAIGSAPFEQVALHLVALARENAPDIPVILPEAAFVLAAALPKGNKSLWEFCERGQTLLDEAYAAAPDAPGRLASECRFAALRSAALAAAGKKGDAKTLLAAALARVAPLLAQAPAAGDHATLWHNRFVAIAAHYGLNLPAAFEMRESHSLAGRLWVDLPRTPEWSLDMARVDNAGFGLVRRQRSGEGEVHVYFLAWRGGLSLEGVDGTTAATDQVGAMANLLLRNQEVRYQSDARSRSNLKTKLSKHIPKTIGFEVSGRLQRGDPCFTRGWVFRSEAQKATICIRVDVFGVDRSVDPEVEAFLATVREPKAR